MKTLDEVIDDLKNKSRLVICTKPKDDYWVVPLETIQDALQYLKMYKELAQESELFAKWKEEKNSDPLTWDELREMEGKPVYIEMNNGYEPRIVRHWFIITKFVDTVISGEEMMCEPIWHFPKRWMGDTWQAYRKERK